MKFEDFRNVAHPSNQQRDAFHNYLYLQFPFRHCCFLSTLFLSLLFAVAWPGFKILGRAQRRVNLKDEFQTLVAFIGLPLSLCTSFNLATCQRVNVDLGHTLIGLFSFEMLPTSVHQSTRVTELLISFSYKYIQKSRKKRFSKNSLFQK